MNIIVEGPDNSGKSTLVHVMASMLNMPVIHSTGPSESAEAFNMKAKAFLSHHGTIFDRHCIVSEEIYGAARGRILTDATLRNMFYTSSKIIIVCIGDHTLNNHEQKEHDTDEHIRFIKRRHQEICIAYEFWALKHAHILYRKGEPPHRIVRFIQGELSK